MNHNVYELHTCNHKLYLKFLWTSEIIYEGLKSMSLPHFLENKTKIIEMYVNVVMDR